MVYQDHLAKFCVLRTLTSKRVEEVAYQMLDIFLLLNAPEILQNYNESDFTTCVINFLIAFSQFEDDDSKSAGISWEYLEHFFAICISFATAPHL